MVEAHLNFANLIIIVTSCTDTNLLIANKRFLPPFHRISDNVLCLLLEAVGGEAALLQCLISRQVLLNGKLELTRRLHEV